MPTQTAHIIDSAGDLYHIYNKGVENRILFKDNQDYGVFLGFLKEYLTVPLGREDIKKTFSIKGKTFQGVPHQPKNYFNSIELLAFNLRPNHFHLLINQKVKGSLEKLIRSLSTRYAIYYNKKYHRSGSLFAGPYKSSKINDSVQLLLLTRYLHREALSGIDHNTTDHQDFSSYREYLGSRITEWIKPELVLSYFDKFKSDYFKGVSEYKNFVEGYVLKQNEKETLDKIVFDTKVKDLEADTDKDTVKPSEEFKVNEHRSDKELPSMPAPVSRFGLASFIISSTLIFVFLSFLGVRNVKSYLTQNNNVVISVQPTPEVAGEVSEVEDIIETPASGYVINTPTPEYKESVLQPESTSSLSVKVITGSNNNINLRDNATTSAQIIGKAIDGDTFILISQDGDWYQIMLADGTIAYISSSYAQIEGGNQLQEK